MIVNEQGEWESKNDREDEDIQEETESNEGNEIQPDEGDNNCFISLRVLSVIAVNEENGQRHNQGASSITRHHL